MTGQGPINESKSTSAGRRRRQPGLGAFTLLELMVVISIMVIMLSIVTLVFRTASDSAVLAQAKNTILTYAKFARSYAVSNQIETMLVVNPRNGHLELWRLNARAGGGPWDPQSTGTSGWTRSDRKDPLADGYTFVPILDSGARIPTDSSGAPRAAVFPIDYDYRPRGTNTDAEMDNLNWAAFCFDAQGQLVIRTRRIATRTYHERDGVTVRPPNIRNRLQDGTPDPSILTNPLNTVRRAQGLVSGFAGTTTLDSGDTAITSTRGFIICDADAMRDKLPADPTTDELVTQWLLTTRPTFEGAKFSETVILNRYSGQELAEAY